MAYDQVVPDQKRVFEETLMKSSEIKILRQCCVLSSINSLLYILYVLPLYKDNKMFLTLYIIRSNIEYKLNNISIIYNLVEIQARV